MGESFSFLQKIDALSARPLTSDEITLLEENGNSAEKWADITVSSDFTPDVIHNSRFIGTCHIGALWKTRNLAHNRKVHSRGIYNSTIAHSILLDSVAVFDSYIAGRGLIEDGVLPFGIGTACNPGLESGGRQLRLFPEINRDFAMHFCEHPGDITLRERCNQIVTEYEEKIGTYTLSIIDEDVMIEKCPRLCDVYVGPGSRLSGALDISACTILSTKDSPTTVGPGVICRSSLIQEGSIIDSGAYVETSGILQFCHIDRHATISESLVGPEMTCSEGEITASFVGPFVGFHHQALLISAFWPDGKGNVGYGANIGSNHTSRKADQEIWPGEGMFFGLGCSVKFPAHFRNAPYSIIATGVVTMPQRMEFPFSCIVSSEQNGGEIPAGYNRILPAWCIYSNMYMCVRGSYKLVDRSRLVWDDDFLSVFREAVIRKVFSVQRKLRLYFDQHPPSDAITNTIITDSDIPELGKNYVYVKDVERGLEWYEFLLRYYCLEKVFHFLSGKNKKYSKGMDIRNLVEFQGKSFLQNIYPAVFGFNQTLSELGEIYNDILTTMDELTMKSMDKDTMRGSQIIDDYSLTHPAVEEDPVIIRFKRWIEDERRKIMV